MKTFQRRAHLGKLAVAVALLATTAVMVAGPASATTATTLYVASTGTATAGCASSSPCTTIYDGVMAAYALEDLNNTSVTVHVAAGTYDDNDDITVPSGDTLTLEGAGAGSTIVDGTDNGTVFTVTSGSQASPGVLIIDGFTVEDGNGDGGGVDNDGTVTLTNDTLSGDVSSGEGGGLYNQYGATAILTNDTLSNDSSNSYGGGVYNDGTATLTNDTITNDSAGDGGGVYNDADGTATLSNDTLTNDVASDGGGVYNSGAATLTNDTVSNDSAPTNYGGGVANNDIITLANDTLSGDSAEYGGGVYNADVATLINDTLFGDSATTEGGGVFNGTKTATLTFDTLSNDTAPTDSGGGVYNLSGTASLANSILDVASCSGNIGDGDYNVESDDSCGFGSNDLTSNTFINLATSLAANGSSGPETLAIGANSSAFEEVPSNCIGTDERGLARPGLTGQSCDAGAYEAQPQSVTLFVGSTGSATTGCIDSSNPCTTIQEGVTAAELYVGSVTVDVAAGTYGGNITISVPSGNTLNLEGAGAGSTIIDGGDSGRDFWVEYGVVVIDGFSIEDGYSGGYGGGVFNQGTATLTNDMVTGDSAHDGGGVFNHGTATFTNDTFSGDSASYGGGVYNAGGASLTNDTLVGDSAISEGGGVFNGDTATNGTMTYDTLSNDTAPSGNGGGIYNGSGIAILANSILNAASCSGPVGDGGYNVESDNTCGLGSSDVVQSTAINLADEMAANGSSGPETLAIGPGSSAFEEVPASACITTDERGEPRPGQLGQRACDAGAYEYQHAAPVVRRNQSIDFGPLASVSVTSTNLDVSATATSGLAVTFTSSTPSVCTVNDVTVSVLAIGTCLITAGQAGDAVFTAAPSVTQSFSVTAAPPTLPGPPVITVVSPFKGRLRITLTSPASAASTYQYSIDGRAWVKLAGNGPFTLSGLAHVVVSVRVRGVNVAGSGRASNARRVRVRP